LAVCDVQALVGAARLSFGRTDDRNQLRNALRQGPCCGDIERTRAQHVAAPQFGEQASCSDVSPVPEAIRSTPSVSDLRHGVQARLSDGWQMARYQPERLLPDRVIRGRPDFRNGPLGASQKIREHRESAHDCRFNRSTQQFADIVR
jgi:hypothetical protein